MSRKSEPQVQFLVFWLFRENYNPVDGGNTFSTRRHLAAVRCQSGGTINEHDESVYRSGKQGALGIIRVLFSCLQNDEKEGEVSATQTR